VDGADADRVTQRVIKGHPALLDAAADTALLVVGSRGRRMSARPDTRGRGVPWRRRSTR